MNANEQNDSVTARLRAQAAAFDPAPPAGLRREVFGALAAARPAAAAHSTAWRFILTASTAVAAVAIAIAVLRHNRPAHQPAPQQVVHQPVVTPANALPSATNPLALAQQWIDQPFEGELQNVMTDLSRTGNTVARILPSPTRRAKPTTQSPAGV